MRQINYIIIHCSATEAGSGIDIRDIDRWHRQKGWLCVGYHYVITENGQLQQGRTLDTEGAHCLYHNKDSIGVCYVGGMFNGAPTDTRTAAQCARLEICVRNLLRLFPEAKLCGHRDLSPDRNGDGEITPDEWTKMCPCFNVAAWARSVGIPAKNIY